MTYEQSSELWHQIYNTFVSNLSMYIVRNVWNWRSAGNSPYVGNSIHLAECLSNDFIKSDIKIGSFLK